MTCPRRARAEFNKRWSPTVGSSAAASLFSSMFFAGISPGAVDVRVEYRRNEEMLVARCLSRNFELQVQKNGYLITVLKDGVSTRVSDPVDVRKLVGPAA